jgi:hypothetical protein
MPSHVCEVALLPQHYPLFTLAFLPGSHPPFRLHFPPASALVTPCSFIVSNRKDFAAQHVVSDAHLLPLCSHTLVTIILARLALFSSIKLIAHPQCYFLLVPLLPF